MVFFIMYSVWPIFLKVSLYEIRMVWQPNPVLGLGLSEFPGDWTFIYQILLLWLQCLLTGICQARQIDSHPTKHRQTEKSSVLFIKGATRSLL